MRDLFLSVVLNHSSSSSRSESIPSVNEFLQVYRAFGTPEELVSMCKVTFKQLGKYSPEDQQKLLHIIYDWLNVYWGEDFTSTSAVQLLQWAQSLASSAELQNKFKLLLIKVQHEVVKGFL